MFKVGDRVITSRGEIGKITEICNCDGCKARGFYEPQIKTLLGNNTILCTDSDYKDGFRSFYQIGEQIYGNIDGVDLWCEIMDAECHIRQKQREVELMKKQHEELLKLAEVERIRLQRQEIEEQTRCVSGWRNLYGEIRKVKKELFSQPADNESDGE